MPAQRWPRFQVIVTWATLWVLVVFGCATAPQPYLPDLPLPPQRTQVRVGARYIFHSDVALTADHAVLREVAELPERIHHELELPPADGLVHAYVFADRGAYERYLHAHFRYLPPRRAFFMARPGQDGQEEMLVFVFWGERILEDLRHELTHAELHSVCPNIPMWLDEGLAEFFELPAEQDGVHYRHLAALRSELASPWSPNLERMERLTLLRDMTPQDYREAWAWVHFLLRGPAVARSVLIGYIRDLHWQSRSNLVLERSSQQVSFATRLRREIAHPEKALTEHLARLNQSHSRLSQARP